MQTAPKRKHVNYKMQTAKTPFPELHFEKHKNNSKIMPSHENKRLLEQH